MNSSVSIEAAHFDLARYHDLCTHHGSARKEYEHGYPFLVQYLRRGARILSNGRSAACITTDHRGDPKLISAFGIAKAYHLQELLSDWDRPLFVENVPVAIASRLQAEPGWSIAETSPYEDQLPESTFPQVAIDLDRLASSSSDPALWCRTAAFNLRGSAKRFRRDVRFGLGRLWKLKGRLQRWNPSYLEPALRCLQINAGWHVQRCLERGASISSASASFSSPGEFLIRACARELDGWVAVTDTEVLAFALTYRVDAHRAGVYANASKPDLPCAMDVMIAAVAIDALRAGMREVLLGGSETESLYRFKSKIGDVRRRTLLALMFRP